MPKIPQNSFLDSQGKRYQNVFFDVMTNNGRRFLRQIKVVIGIHFDFSFGDYVADILFEQLESEILRQHPSLASVKGATFIPTKNRIR